MIDRLKQSAPGRTLARLADWTHSWAVPALLRRRVFGAAFVATVLAALYWGLLASDRYVSEAHVVIQRTDLSAGASLNIGTLLGGSTPGNQDQLMLLDHLLSMDMLRRLDEKLDLRSHYSDSRRDPISRMWFSDAKLERFHEHYLSRVLVEYDDYTGILTIQAQAYDPKTAHAIATMLVEEGERFMNDLAHNLANAQVSFLEKQVGVLQQRVIQARHTLLDFQNRNRLASPQGTAENLAAVVNRLEAQLSDLKARRSAMLGYLMPDSGRVVEIDLQIAAIQKQAQAEMARLAAPNSNTLNRTVEEYQRLQLNAEFEQDVYRTALVALESGRVEATRTLKKLSVLQQPFEPQHPIEPRRIYNIVVFMLLALVIAGALQLMAAIIRDHRD
jgi:capsular polysaccharide transport system permease protein